MARMRDGTRQAYSAQFKLQVVRDALRRPINNRIKPTCREHPGIEPVQLRKWIRNISTLELAEPDTKHISRVRPCTSVEQDEESGSDVSSTTSEESPLDVTYSEQLWLTALGNALGNSRSTSPVSFPSYPCSSLRLAPSPVATSPFTHEHEHEQAQAQACAAQLLSLRRPMVKLPVPVQW